MKMVKELVYTSLLNLITQIFNMATFAKGKYSQVISDRSGQAFPYNEMVKEWTGELVHISEYEAKHPQISPRYHAADPVALQNARPDRVEPAVRTILPLNPFRSQIGLNFLLVNEPDHERQTGDIISFAYADGFGGFSPNTLNNTNGYSITLGAPSGWVSQADFPTDDFYYVNLGVTATQTAIGGGGAPITVGPTTTTP